MKKKLIEMVCEGNFSRSRIAEAIGTQYIKESELDEKYEVTSSGIYVGKSPEEKIAMIPESLMNQFINLGKQRGIYSDEEINLINEALKNKDRTALKNQFLKSAMIFEEEEIKYREEILDSFGIDKKSRTIKNKTIPREDNVAVLSMDNRINKIVKPLYEGTNYEPIIDVLGIFATENPNAELPSIGMYGSKEAYFNTVEKLKHYVPLAINRIIDSSK